MMRDPRGWLASAGTSKLSRLALFATAAAIVPVTAAAAPLGPPISDGNRASDKRVDRDKDRTRPFVPGEVIVRFRSGVEGERRAAIRQTHAATLEETLPIPGGQVLDLPRGDDVRAAANELERLPEVLYAQPNYIRHSVAFPNDARFGAMWGLHNTGQSVPNNHESNSGGGAGRLDADIDAPEAWDITTGSRDVIVAVVDSGVDGEHPALRANMWRNPREIPNNNVDDDGNGFRDDVSGWDFEDDDNDASDVDRLSGGNSTSNHGTHVAGTIGARGNDGADITGVNWQVSLMPVRALGTEGGSDADVAQAFDYAARNGAKVVNASLGGPGAGPAIDEVVGRHPNTLYVVAAGNGGSDGRSDNNDAASFSPCNSTRPNLICVAASDQADRLTEFSNYGRSNVDLAAPGQSILSAVPPVRTKLFEPFEDSNLQFRAPGWTTDGTRHWGGSDHLGPWWAADSPGLCWPGIATSGCYGPNVNSHMYSPTIDLRDCARGTTRLSYDLYTQIEGLENGSLTDYLAAKVTSAGRTETYAYHYGNWGPGTLDYSISEFEGSEAKLDFHFHSDAFNPNNELYNGAFVDYVTVNCRTNTYNSDDFIHIPGTSMASPHVAGVAGLLWAANPGASMAQVRDSLLGGVDAVPELSSYVRTGGRLNARKALDALPKPPPPPPPPPPPGPAPGPTPGPQPQPQPQPQTNVQKAGKCSRLKGKRRRTCIKKACGRLKSKPKRYRTCVKKVTRRGGTTARRTQEGDNR